MYFQIYLFEIFVDLRNKATNDSYVYYEMKIRKIALFLIGCSL